MRIIDRYVIREVLWPFVIGLVVFTFLLIIPYLIRLAEDLIAKGVSGTVILQLMIMLLPSSLSLTIPMSLLIGLLVAFGRLSADREFVAMQGCGVSLMRLLRPVGLLSAAGFAATCYMLVVALPNANQASREIMFDVVAARAEGEVRPRVFFEDFPDVTLYVREVSPSGAGWTNVFMADTRGGSQAIYLAEHGRVLIDRTARTVEMILEDGSRHRPDADGKYEVFRFERLRLSLNPESVFPRAGPAKGDNEMTIAELRMRAAQFEKEGISTHNQWMAIHRKFSIPAACLVFALIGLALGATNRRDGKLASFVIGIAIIFVYYVVLWMGQAMAKGHMLPPWLAVWLPNFVLGTLGLLMFAWRKRAADQPLRILVPAFWRRSEAEPAAGPKPPGAVRRTAGFASRAAGVLMPMPGILDRYVATSYVRVLALSALGMAGIFYISTFLDLADEVFKGQATWAMLGEYFWYATPQYVYYILPLSVLLATLVTIGLLTKNSELVVMKACGISLYRVALPMLVGGLLAGGILFLLEESVLGPSNRRAEAIRHVIRGGSPQTFDLLTRRWIVGADGEIYNYNYFDPRTHYLQGVSIYEFDRGMNLLRRRVYAERAMHVAAAAGTGDDDVWRAEQGWSREFDEHGEPNGFMAFPESNVEIEPPAYFATQQPDPDYMSYSQLRGYIGRLRDSGFDVIAQQVALERKISFPFVTLIMTLIAVPFAVTTGRRGAMYGVGIGIVLAISYWVTFSVFAALGTGGLLTPLLAAWAPNLLFGAGAAYLLLTVRT
jgi:LPS export ABC transporter permease LptG/LPS export ABC transporter permease LptF